MYVNCGLRRSFLVAMGPGTGGAAGANAPPTLGLEGRSPSNFWENLTLALWRCMERNEFRTFEFQLLPPQLFKRPPQLLNRSRATALLIPELS